MARVRTEVNEFQNKLQNMYNKMLRLIFFMVLIISGMLIFKFALFYFVFQINENESQESTAEKILNFFSMPELAHAIDTSLLDWQDITQMISGIMFNILIIFTLFFIERDYKKEIANLQRPLLFLFTLEVSGLKDKENAKDFIRIIQILRPNDDLILSECFVYDMANYNYEKERLALENKEKENPGMLTSPEMHAIPTDSDFIKIQKSHELVDVFFKIKEHDFSNKLLITLNDLIIIRDIINVYHSGLLPEKIKREIKRAVHDKTHNEEDLTILKNSVDVKEGFLDGIEIKLAHDVNDIRWPSYSSIKKNFSKYFYYIAVVVATFIFCTAIFICKRLYVIEMLKLKFKDKKGFAIGLPTGDYILNGVAIFLLLVNLFLPLVGISFIKRIFTNIEAPFLSSSNNIAFFGETLVEIFLRILATHYGYTSGMLDMKPEIAEDKLDEFYYYINIEWVIIAFLLLISFILKILFSELYKVYERYSIRKSKNKSPDVSENQGTQKKPKQPQPLNNNITSSNVITIFMYLGFYHSLLSTLALILISINLLLTFLYDKHIKNDAKRTRSFISYYNITFIIQFSLFVFNLGGCMAFSLQYNYSHVYFNDNFDINFFPYFLITCIITIVVYSPILLLLTRHNSVSLRVLDYLIKNEIQESQQEGLNNFIWEKNYRKENPYYAEAEKLDIREEI